MRWAQWNYEGVIIDGYFRVFSDVKVRVREVDWGLWCDIKGVK